MDSVCLPSDALLQHLTSYLVFSYFRLGVCLHVCSSKVQPFLLTLDEGYLLTATPPDLERGLDPLGPPAPLQQPLLGSGVPPLGRWPWPQMQGSSSRPLRVHKYSMHTNIWLKQTELWERSHLKSINSSELSFLYSPTLTSIHEHWKNHSLD